MVAECVRMWGDQDCALIAAAVKTHARQADRKFPGGD